jgi:hypothetical protein
VSKIDQIAPILRVDPCAIVPLEVYSRAISTDVHLNEQLAIPRPLFLLPVSRWLCKEMQIEQHLGRVVSEKPRAVAAFVRRLAGWLS